MSLLGWKNKREKNEEGLLIAAAKGDTNTVKILLAKGADVNVKDMDDNTALMVAALGGHADTVKDLLAKGADINAINKTDNTALMAATSEGHTKIVKLLKQMKTRH